MSENTSLKTNDKSVSKIVKKGKRKINIKTSYECRLLEFNALDGEDLSIEDNSDSNDEQEAQFQNKFIPKAFNVQMFGIDDKGKTYSITAINYCPFFYIKVGDHWDNSKKFEFLKFIIKKLDDNKKKYKSKEIKDIRIVKSKTLYGFDNDKLHTFIVLRFSTLSCYYTVKKFWYNIINNEMKLMKDGIKYGSERLPLYEGHIPPLIRMFHIKNISPSGWVRIQRKYATELKSSEKKTTCHYEFIIDYSKIESLVDKETPVPYKICSFDIEASSSHGDFPLPVKTYKKLCDQFLEFFESVYFQSYNNDHSLIMTQENANIVFSSNIIQLFMEVMIADVLLHKDNFHTRLNIDYVEEKKRLYSKIKSRYSEKHAEIVEKVYSMFMEYVTLFVDKIYLKYKFTSLDNFISLFDCGFKALISDIDTNYNSQMNNEDDTDVIMNYFESMKEDQDIVSYHNQHYETNDDWDAESIDGVKNTKKMKQNTSSKKQMNKIMDNIASNIKYDAKQRRIKLMNNKELSLSLDSILSKTFPKVNGDQVTFIGSTFRKNGEDKPYLNHCLVLGECDGVEDAEIKECKDEKHVLLEWSKLIQKEDPDIIIGYNIFGFDYVFMFNRAKENNITDEFLKLSRNKDESSGKVDWATKKVNLHKLSIKLASGEHSLYYPLMNGRLQIDLLNYFRREFNLEMYKLDFTAGYFISDKVKGVYYDKDENKTKIISNNLVGLERNAYIKIKETSHSDNYYKNGSKFKVVSINADEGYFYLDGCVSPNMKTKVSWCLSKDDVSPQQIFEYTNQGAEKKAIVAKYCIQDCNLVHELLKKIDVVTGFVEMANICSVPLSFIVLRGQGIKLTSYISKKCREKNTLMPTLNKQRSGEGYEGAIVLEPKTNLYLDDPVACVDYSSLYPSSMISENLCHSSKVWTKTYDLSNNMVSYTGETDENGVFIYDNLPNFKYVDIEFDTFRYYRKTPKSAAVKVKNGKKVCRFAQYKEKKSILPSVLEELLAARKATKKLKAIEKDPFMKNIYDKRQLSIKVTANSIYGQTGASVGDFFEPDVAASTTATGRKLLTYARKVIEDVYGDNVCNTKNHGKVKTKAEYIYGDTDSVFFCFNLQEMDGTPIKGQKALEITIELAKEAGGLATKFLKNPHDLEYEKTFLPFCLLSKKRYVGMLYEEDPSPNACYRKSMGIVLKRRDNAPIVKDVYGGIIDILMKEQSIDKSVDFLNDMLKKLVNGEIHMDKLIITKSLRGHYANPKQIAHKVLADRITLRDPGNKPCAGERIPFVYIENKDKKALQGDKIELPNYIKEHKLKIDYSHYVTNQIMKPVLQLYALVLEKLPQIRNKKSLLLKIQREIESHGSLEHDKYIEKKEKIRCNYAKKYLFDDTITKLKVKKSGNQTITSLFAKKI